MNFKKYMGKREYTIEELAQMAYKGARSDFKTLLRGSEQSTYLALRYLYRLYQTGGISKEEAGKTKAQIARRYEKDRLREEQLERSIKAFAQVVLMTAKANEDYRRERTLDNADKLCEAIDGVIVQSNIAETKGLADEV